MSFSHHIFRLKLGSVGSNEGFPSRFDNGECRLIRRFLAVNTYNLSNLDVLIVERHGYMRRVMRDILHALGVDKIRQTADIDEAYDLFQENPADLILTDWSPAVDGMALLGQVRDLMTSANAYVPVIVVTANTEPRHIFAARDQGMTEFLAKPITATLLYSRICSVIERARPFVRASGFFGPDRRRRSLGPLEEERREHANMNGSDRRIAELPYEGPERRHAAPEARTDARIDTSAAAEVSRQAAV